jgi:putative ABC transport system substrate-binding protein
MRPFSALCPAEAVRVAALAIALSSLAIQATAQHKVWRVGLLSNSSSVPSLGPHVSWPDGLLLSLDQNGYRLGENLQLVARYSEGHTDRLPGLAQEIATAGVDVVLAVSDTSLRAMLATTQTTPIVMVVGDDPVASGMVASMAHPGGRVTGLAFQTNEGDVKRLQLLREAIPDARLFGLLEPPGAVRARVGVLTHAASLLNVEVTVHKAAGLAREQYAAAMGAMRAEGVAGVLIAATQAWAGNPTARPGQIAQEQGLPAICEWDYMARAEGCVFAYGHDLRYAHRRAGWYVARILQGASPAHLPVEQPDAWKLTINLQSAARLGLTIPPALLARADEVIE